MPPQTIVAFHLPEGFKAGGIDPERVATDALVNTSAPAVEHILPRLLAFTQQEAITVTLEVDGIPNSGKYQLLTRLLRKLRFVKEVDAGQQFSPGGTSRFQIVYREQPDLLMSQLRRLPGFEVQSLQNLLIKARHVDF